MTTLTNAQISEGEGRNEKETNVPVSVLVFLLQPLRKSCKLLQDTQVFYTVSPGGSSQGSPVAPTTLLACRKQTKGLLSESFPCVSELRDFRLARRNLRHLTWRRNLFFFFLICSFHSYF